MSDQVESELSSQLSVFPILIVDDEPALRDILSQILDGYAVTTAANGIEAIRLLENRQFELVITDLMMPAVDGLAVLEAARRFHPPTKVLVLTGYLSSEDEAQCHALGCHGILSKPFAATMIRARVAECLEHRHMEFRV